MTYAKIVKQLMKLGRVLTSWSLRNPRMAVEILLVAAIVILGWLYKQKAQALLEAGAEYGQLQDGLQQQITIANGQIEILKKEKGKVKVERVYVPPEGSVVVKQADWDKLNREYQDIMSKLANVSGMSKDEVADLQRRLKELLAKLSGMSQNGQGTEVVVKDKGFTFKPGFGIEWAGRGLSPRLDAKWLYFKRYSALVGGGRDGLDIGVSRHLDDILIGSPRNIELFGGYKVLRLHGSGYAVVGFRSNF